MSTSYLLPGVQVPYSQEAEEALLGSILENPAAYLDVAAMVTAEDFYILRHSYIWDAYKQLSERGETIDFITTQEALRAASHLDDIGGPAYLLQLSNRYTTSATVWAYAELIRRAALRRRMLTVSDEIKALALLEDMDAEKAYLEGMQRYDAIQVRDREHYLPGTLSIERYADVLDEVIKRRERGEMVGYPLPETWDRLGEVLPMVFPGDFVVVSGPPGGGKSAMLETWAEWCAAQGLVVDYLHTEMSTEQLLHRRMARHSGIPYHVLASGQVERGPMFDRVIDADQKIGDFSKNIAYHWMPDVKFNRLASEMRRALMRGVKVFFIDHFQDIQIDSAKGQNEVRAFEAMCVWFAAFAENQKVIVIMASQQNARGGTKWSTKLVEKAVVWLSIKRERLTSDYAYVHHGVEVRALRGEDSPVAEVSVNKARFGKKAKLKMLYHGPGFTFLDMSRIQRPAISGKVVSMEDIRDRQTAKQEVQA